MSERAGSHIQGAIVKLIVYRDADVNEQVQGFLNLFVDGAPFLGAERDTDWEGTSRHIRAKSR